VLLVLEARFQESMEQMDPLARVNATTLKILSFRPLKLLCLKKIKVANLYWGKIICSESVSDIPRIPCP
jgi:hypothetical protein